MNDLRCAVRSLARMRGLAAIVIAALAIGIGATTTNRGRRGVPARAPGGLVDPIRVLRQE